MAITAKIIADSVSPEGIRLTTMQLRYPKFIHGEVMTHRVFSRNASSSRAIPVERMIQDVLDDPAMPVWWGKNQAGMQALEELSNINLYEAKKRWLLARDSAVTHAHHMIAEGAHKQIVNRVLEPWCHINVVVTATEWANFFALRRHKDAQPEMHALADAMWEAREVSTPKVLHPGDWHTPYVDPSVDITLFPTWPKEDVIPQNDWFVGCLIKCSVARCARVSYLTHEGRPPNIDDDLKLYDRLVGAAPIHASPAEHQATPDDIADYSVTMTMPTENQRVAREMSASVAIRFAHPEQHGNFIGWRQFRKTLPDENIKDR
jgi:hypothetical protein